jgi:hypothetical protein
MIVARIILICPFANKPHQEIAIYTFVVVERHQVKVVQPEYRRDAENYDRTNSPITLREVTWERRFHQPTLAFRFNCGASLLITA